MNTTDLVHYLSTDTPSRQAAARPALAPSRHELAAPVRNFIFRARNELIDAQRVDGSWVASTGCDAASSALLVLLDAYLDREPSELAVAAILREQTSEGGWSLQSGGAFDLDRSVLAYFALKLAGENANRPELARARQTIRAHGGADGCSAMARLWFALLGQIDFETCPPIAPEQLLMPGCTDNLSATDICLLAARSVIWAMRPTREVPLSRGIRELFVKSPPSWPAPKSSNQHLPFPSFTGFWKGCERIGWLPLRRRSIERADFLLAEATIDSTADDIRCDELVWRRIALKTLGHADRSRVVVACQRLLDHFALGEPDDARSRPHTNLTTDTALAIEALSMSGVGVDDDPLAAAIDWLLSHRLNPAHSSKPQWEIAALVQVCGCLQARDQQDECALPPDIKLASARRQRQEQQDRRPAAEFERFTDNLLGKAISWQRSNGGWAVACNHAQNRRVVGFLHAHERRSPSESDAGSTGRMLELVARVPRTSSRTSIARGLAFLRSSQRGDGSWPSADGNSSTRATAWAIRGLLASGAEADDSVVAAGVNWLLVHQQVSGGWSASHERATSDEYENVIHSSARETAAAVFALVQAGLANDDATRRGIEVLLNGDAADERDLEAIAWKLIALSNWQVAIAKLEGSDEPASLRLVCGDATP